MTDLAVLDRCTQVANNQRFNEFESVLAEGIPLESRVYHRFTPGLYIRECHLVAGGLYTTKIHKTEHPLMILSGVLGIWTDNGGIVYFKSPSVIITPAGTRRALYCFEDCVGVTCHVNPSNETDVEKIERDIIFTCENPLIAQKSQMELPI